ncbi:ESPR-type extended signal peptide-containing protein [uncultured Megasphaera sp.]|uniref:ESPR-type extended signal peptide-containing protein n=1 Tax=uncultured Megasphaera sp. TaxID=165188 RepID=UPI00258AEB7F|nr:ESPR-type extended signal peptide-containing protein [uncultured Megasphaera sp.]
MNRAYKVIWSKARHCYVVVSELTKSQHKSSSKSELISTNVHREGNFGKAAIAVIVAGLLTFGGVAYSPVLAADNTTVKDSNGNTVTNTDKNIKDINANITGKDNKVTDSSNAEIVGDGNTVTNEAKGEDGSVRYVRSDDVRIHGSGNTISASRNQQVIGDNNQIIGRDTGRVTDYQHPEGREPNVSDLTIGRGNFIRSADTYRNEWDSLKVIGNNNRADFKIESAGGPAAGIVIGDNQNIDQIKDSIVIGSLSPTEREETVVNNQGDTVEKYLVGEDSIILGYHASNSAGESVVVGNHSQANNFFQTVVGHRSVVEGANEPGNYNGSFASSYGSLNKIENTAKSLYDYTDAETAKVDGFGNNISGNLNTTSNATGTMVIGQGNTISNSQNNLVVSMDGDKVPLGLQWVMNVEQAAAGYSGKGAITLPASTYYDMAQSGMRDYMTNSSGAVSVLGNGNAADYAVRSQILGTGNSLTGTETDISAYNTVSGFANSGTNVKRTAIVGTGNTLKSGEDNVVIGDYHQLEGGKHNVILGSMATEEKTVTKKAKYSAGEFTDDNPDASLEYTVKEQVPVKANTKDIENAVMLGYNTDVTENGGVALGSDSIASTKAGVAGYDALKKTHAKSDKDYAAWNATDAAVSVGGADREIEYDVLDKDGKPETNEDGSKKTAKQTVKSTRQITNLAAGTEDTDAVNVAQLKNAQTRFYSVNSTDSTKGNYYNNGATGINAIAAGVGANTNIDNSIAMGTNAQTLHSGGTKDTTQMGTGDIAIGDNAHTNNYIDQGGSIAIGQNAFAENMTGVQESSFAFGQTKYTPVYKSDYYWGYVPYAYLPENPSKVPGGLAIGQNTYVRTGGLMVGTHNYKGKLGDVEVDSADTGKNAKSVFTTTLGTNSFNSGAFSTITGAYSIASSDYEGGNSTSAAGKNFGATIMGSLNSIESSTASSNYSGVANSIVGTANRTFNSNGSLIFGAGNEITNSVTTISAPSDGGVSAQALQKTLMQTVKDSNGGGATLAIGGGNKIDHAVRSQAIGVNNTLTGNLYHKDGLPSLGIPDVNEYSAQYNMVDGYNNNVANVNHAYVIGTNNNIQGKTFSDATKDGVLSETDREKAKKDDNLIVIGDNHTLANDVSNNIILGTADKTLTTSASNVVMIGHNADAQKEGGVALGSGSVASTDKDVEGYDPLKKGASKSDDKAWKSSWAAVSVGDGTHTRQITGVAAGFADTDAVNVAQLKSVASLPVHIYSGGKGSSDSYTAGSPVATPTISSLQFDFGDGLKAEEVGAEGDKRVLVSLDKDALKGDPDFKGDPGKDGKDGKDGAVGPQGPAGKDGKDGKDGAVGPLLAKMVKTARMVQLDRKDLLAKMAKTAKTVA